MSRINTNVQSMIAQRVLGQNNMNLNQSLERLSTGLRIARGKDDPAGLIASENLRSDIRATESAISNAERADQVMNIAEGGLQEVSTLLTELQGLLTATASEAGLSREEREANQLQIDSILQTIDRLASSTNFQGIKLLNGNFDYEVDKVAEGVDNYRVNGAKFAGETLDVEVAVTQSAQQARLFLDLGGSVVDLQGGTGSAFTVEIVGSLGSRQLSFASGTTTQTMVDTINNYTTTTGVEAEVAAATGSAGAGVILQSAEYGKEEFVSVSVVDDGGIQDGNRGIYKFLSDDANTVDMSTGVDFDSNTASNMVRDSGQDIRATVNGVQATANGRDIRVNTDFLDVEITLDRDTSQQVGSIDAFTINGGGANFMLAANVDIGGRVSIGIGDVATRKMGKVEDDDTDGKFYFLDALSSGSDLNVVDGDLDMAQKVVNEAISNISGLRGRLGAFQKNVVGATVRSLGVALENTAAAESSIRDADFAAETSALTRNQILSQASSNILALANQQPQAALQLLG